MYGSKGQYDIIRDEDPVLSPTDTKTVQQITGNIWDYARAIESPVSPALNKISHRQTPPPENTMDKCKMVLDFCASHPNATIRFYASDMILYVDTDAAYLVLSGENFKLLNIFTWHNVHLFITYYQLF